VILSRRWPRGATPAQWGDEDDDEDDDEDERRRNSSMLGQTRLRKKA